MKVLQFTIPVPDNQTIISQQEVLPYFYPYLHRHEEIQLTWVQKGEGTLIADNSIHNFGSHEIFWLSARQPHLFKSEPSYFLPKSKKMINALTIFFNPEGSLKALFSLPEMQQLQKFVTQQMAGFQVPQQHVGVIANLMVKVNTSNGAERITYFIEILRKLHDYRKISPLSSFAKAQRYSENEGMRVAGIYNYIMQHHDRQITLEDVAKQAHMKPQAFCRYFKKHTRHTFISFLNEVRINEACKQLTDGSYNSISNVAYRCGFNSITNFNRVFKSVTSLSPSQYVNNFTQHVE